MKQELEDLLAEDHFSPIDVTMNNGFSIVISNPRKTLLNSSMLIVMDDAGQFHHLALQSIAHIRQPEQK
jgi:hypothetical protein